MPKVTWKSQAAIEAAKAAQAQREADIAALLQNIRTTAASAEGVLLTDLTAGQIKALMACLLYQAGGVDPATGTVRPLSEWVMN